MDVLQGAFLPPKIPSTASDSVLDSALRLLSIYQTYIPYFQTLQSQAQILFTPILNTIALFAQDQNPLLSVAILVGTLYITLSVLGWVRSLIMWWTMFFLRLVFYVAILMVVYAVYLNGLEKTVKDLVAWGTEMGEFWWMEYERHKAGEAAGGHTHAYRGDSQRRQGSGSRSR